MKDWQKVGAAARAEASPFPGPELGPVSDCIRLAGSFVYRVRCTAPNGRKLQVVHEDEFTASKLFALALANNGGPPVVRGQLEGYPSPTAPSHKPGAGKEG